MYIYTFTIELYAEHWLKCKFPPMKNKMSYCQVNVFKWSRFLEKFHFVRGKMTFSLFQAISLNDLENLTVIKMMVSYQADWSSGRDLGTRTPHPCIPSQLPQACSSILLLSCRDPTAQLLLHLCPFISSYFTDSAMLTALSGAKKIILVVDCNSQSESCSVFERGRKNGIVWETSVE